MSLSAYADCPVEMGGSSPNLCFVDTLDNVAGLGIKAGFQHDMFAGLSDENVARVKRQNARKISVIIGNPPYNAWQESFNSRNPNRAYRRIDERIAETYIRKGTAQNKNSVYDMYTRFFRWASDRLHDDGILAFITNRNFIEKAAFDGFRRDVADEFSDIYIVDLGGDVRANPKLSGTKHNVFGIQTGVAMAFLVKRRKQAGSKIFYIRRPEMDSAQDKLAWLAVNKISSLPFARIEPDEKQNWVDLTRNDWAALVPITSKGAKAGQRGTKNQAIFQLFSSGLKSQRDEWVYDLSDDVLEKKMRHLLEVYEHSRKDAKYPARDSIKWDASLDSYLKRRLKLNFEAHHITHAEFRPFVKRWVYLEKYLNGRTYQLLQMFPEGSGNQLISFHGMASSNPLAAFASDRILDLNQLKAGNGTTQAVSRYRYTPDGERIDNITDWGLKQFQKAYGKDGRHLPLEGGGRGEAAGGGDPLDVADGHPTPDLRSDPPPQGEGKTRRILTKDDIFHYVYGVLHDPVYRETYAQNLKREFPRIPFYPDFWAWAAWGRRLMELHIGYETVAPWPIARLDVADEKAREAGVAPKAVLKADKDNGVIRLDNETTLSGIPPEVWTYRLGNRSGIEWILDQYKEKTPKDPTIREKFNTYRFADYKEHVVDLIARVISVSVETVEITEAMKAARR